MKLKWKKRSFLFPFFSKTYAIILLSYFILHLLLAKPHHLMEMFCNFLNIQENWSSNTLQFWPKDMKLKWKKKFFVPLFSKTSATVAFISSYLAKKPFVSQNTSSNEENFSFDNISLLKFESSRMEVCRGTKISRWEKGSLSTKDWHV